MRVIKLQPSNFTDNISDNGEEQTKLPYPFFVNEDGSVRNQDFWRGVVARVVGFQKDGAVQQIDLWWTKAFQDPENTVGMYLVTADNRGTFSTHNTAIMSVEVLDLA